MERVETLCDKLKEQVAAKASIEELLKTVQMLQSELQHLRKMDEKFVQTPGVSFHLPPSFDELQPVNNDKTLTTLEIDEEELVAELEAMKKAAETKNLLSLKNRRPFYFDPIEDTPTLSNQTPTPVESPQKEHSSVLVEFEVKSTPVSPIEDVKQPQTPTPAPRSNSLVQGEFTELNESLNSMKKEVSDSLKDTPIKDLRKAIGINDRFLFISELFQGDENMYERSIKTINGFAIFPEAEYWIRRELKTKLGWNDQQEVVRQFDALVKRRFL
jgi:hypothetical protein